MYLVLSQFINNFYIKSNLCTLLCSSASGVQAGHGVYPLLGPGGVDEVAQELPRAELLTRAPVNGWNVVIIRIIA